MARRERSATLGLAPALPGIVLVVVIVWALAAVLMLTGTLINAREIDDTIPLITSQTSPIDKDTDDIEEAAEVAEVTDGIRDAAAPLSSQANRIIVEARSIDRRASTIFGTAQSINDTAKSINGTARSINDTVGAIGANVASINSTVGAIGSNVASIGGSVSAIGGSVGAINTRVRSIFGLTGSINASATSIRGTFTRLVPETRDIDSGVAGINARADAAIEEARRIKGDFEPIRRLVGPGAEAPNRHSTEGLGTIHGHANSIDCAPVVNALGNTEYCNR